MILLRDLSVLWTLFHVLIIFMLLYRSRYSRKKTLLLTGIAMGALILLNVAGLALYGAAVMGKIFILSCTLPSLLFFWIISRDRNGRFFFTFCMADTVALWILAVTNVADYYFGGEQYVLMFISNFPVIITARSQELPAFLLILVLMPMTYATIFISLYRQHLLFRKQQGERILLEQKNMLEAQLENQQRIRRMKHDMKGHTATIAGLLAAGQTKEALAYLKGVEAEMDTLQGQYCANPYINAVFVHYAGKLEEMGAGYRSDIQIGDEDLPYMELCQILSNGLENACDALKGLEGRSGSDAGKREVSVQMRYNRNYLLIRIRSTCRKDLYVERGVIPATDKPGHDHGFGLATIKEAAERLEGDMVCYTEDGCFVLDVMVRSS